MVQKQRRHEIEAFVRRIVAEIETVKAAGTTEAEGIAEHLNAKGVTTRKGRYWTGATVAKEAVAGGIGALFVLVTPAGAVLVVQIVLIVSEDGETAFAAICFAVA